MDTVKKMLIGLVLANLLGLAIGILLVLEGVV